MPRNKVAKSKRKEAENAGEHCLRESFGCVNIARAVKTQFQFEDIFGSDVIGKDCRGWTYYAQVTTGQSSAVSSRKRKLESIHWNDTDTVMILQLGFEPNGRRKNWHFVVHDYDTDTGKWSCWESPIAVPGEWFKRYRKEVK